MKSRDDQLDLDRGLPVTRDDVEGLRRLRPGGMSFREYIDFVNSFPSPSIEDLRRRPGPSGPPFKLRG